MELNPPVFNKNSNKKFIKLYEEQKTYAKAGGKSGYYTPFKKTAKNLEEVVMANPGISLNDAVDKIQHHYKNKNSAIRTLRKLLEQGNIIKGIYIVFEGNIIRLYHKYI